MIKLGIKVEEITLEWIAQEVQSPNFERSKLHSVLKKELSRLGHWKNKARGKPGFNNFMGKIPH